MARCVQIVYLIDTSAWILHFSAGTKFSLQVVCEPAQRVICLPVYQEILQGIRNESAFRNLKDALDATRFVEDPVTRSLTLEAVQLYRLARRQGITVRSTVDCVIAACALRHNLIVLHSDRDYEALSRISPLRHQKASLVGG